MNGPRNELKKHARRNSHGSRWVYSEPSSLPNTAKPNDNLRRLDKMTALETGITATQLNCLTKEINENHDSPTSPRAHPNAKLVPIENCGHIPHFQAPVKFHAALLEYLK